MVDLATSEAAAAARAPGGRVRKGLVRGAARLVTAGLDLIVTKPIAVCVWWVTNRSNTMRFHRRDELRRRVEHARREGRPVLFASNHVSMFDDPLVPMALYGTGSRSLIELLVLAILVALYWAVPAGLLPLSLPGLAVLAWAAGIAFFGVRKSWWSLGDLVNFSGATALRGKLEVSGTRPLSWLHRGTLAVADGAIYHFMRSGTVKTVLVDRRAGEEAKGARARAVAETVEIAARAEPIWIFFEGRRAKTPGTIGPARRGLGDIFLGLRARGRTPLVVAIRHRGLEHVIPRASRRWVTSGHRIEVDWCECNLELGDEPVGAGTDAQSIADAVRNEVANLLRRDGNASTEDPQERRAQERPERPRLRRDATRELEK